MGNFSVNQVRQLYVVDTVQGSSNTDLKGTVAQNAAAKTVALRRDAEGKNVYFVYKGADNIMRSDLINIDNILYAKAISSDHATQKFNYKTATVKLDANINNGNPISGQDYILRICINPYVGMSDEEPYFKYGAVHAVKDMKPSVFYTKLAASLFMNFSRELGKMLDFTIAGKVVGRVSTSKTGAVTLYDVDGEEIEVEDTYTDGVTITEVEQEWALGIKEMTPVNFTVIPTYVTYDGDEVTWGTVTTGVTASPRNNGRKIADLEYFCMGERGDQYRNVGWPNVIHTKYLVDPETAYDILEIHYAYVGANEGPQRSEKDIVIVIPKANRTTALQKLIKQFETATGITVTTVGDGLKATA